MTARPPIAQFGDAIAVEGVRPAWLPDELWDQVEATLYWGEVQQCILGETNPVMSDWEWPDIKFLKLPVPRYDFVYLALERGMVPWFGGDEAPGDWDGSEVLMRGDVMFDMECFAENDFMWRHDTGSDDIIGYHATSTALPLAHPAAPQGEEDRLREALKRIAYLRPAGDVERCVGAKKLVAQMERIALAALAPAAIASGRGEGE